MMTPERPQPPARASLGEIAFSDDIDPPLRQTIREMWMNRLTGFHQLDLERYLRDNTEATRYVNNGKAYSYRTFRCICRLMFPLRRIGAVFGGSLTAEVFDAHISRDGDRFITRGRLVLRLAGRIVRQSRLVMSIVRRSDRWVWHEAIAKTIPRS